MARYRPLAALLALALLMMLPAARVDALDEFGATLSDSTRLMVFSPHPDDETLGAAGLIQRVLSTGGKVRVVFITSGDGFTEGLQMEKHLSNPTADDYREYGREREKEALCALGTLGLKKEDVTFLGFPDGVLSNLIARFPTAGHPCTSPFTREDHPPGQEIIVPHTEYDGDDVVNEIVHELCGFKPNLIATTPSAGWHPDHCATHYFATTAMMELNRKDRSFQPEVLAFVIHFKRWPMDSDIGASLSPPEDFPDAAHAKDVRWLSLSLSSKELDTKKEAILQYHSQMLYMGSYMLSFARLNELFIKESRRLIKDMAQLPWCGKGVPY